MEERLVWGKQHHAVRKVRRHPPACTIANFTSNHGLIIWDMVSPETGRVGKRGRNSEARPGGLVHGSNSVPAS